MGISEDGVETKRVRVTKVPRTTLVVIEDFRVWVNGSITWGGRGDMIVGADVLTRFRAFMDGWVPLGAVNRVNVGIMLKAEVKARGWDARKEVGYRPIRWSGLRWQEPGIADEIADVMPEFTSWFTQELEVGTADDRVLGTDLRDRFTQELPPGLPLGLLVRELVRTTHLAVTPLGNGGWGGLRWLTNP